MAYSSSSYTPRPVPIASPHLHPHSSSTLNPIPIPIPTSSPNPNTNFATFPTANHSAAISAPALYRPTQQQQHQQQPSPQQHQFQHQDEKQLQHSYQSPNPNPNPDHKSNLNTNHRPTQRPHSQQQQFYPNAYPNNSRSSPPPPLPSLVQPQGTASQVPLPNPSQIHHPHQIQIQIQDLGNGRPSSMPPPSSLPDATFARRAQLQPQRSIAIDRWPSGTNEEQRQMQDQYTQQAQSNFYYNQQHRQQQQPLHPISATPSAPVSTFSAPHHQPHSTPSPAANLSQGQSQMASLTSALEASKPIPQSSATSPLEAQRVGFLLELNSLLLQEVVNIQNAGKTDVPATIQQPSPPLEQGPVTPAAGQRAQQPSSPEDRGSNTPGANQRAQQQMKTAVTKDFIEYMRRLQANLAYLASIAEQNTKPQNIIPQFPAIMDAPAPGPSESENGKEALRDMYTKMKELWPDYKGKT